jgi:tRNA (cytidine/uridine-2'-O-)-methyltransferase
MHADLHVVLVHPEIAWNTGNAGRTCLAMGAQLHLVEPLGFVLDDRRVRRAGLDYWPHVAPRVWPTVDALIDALPNLGAPLALTAEGERAIWEVDLRGPTVLLFGSEPRGLPRDLRERADIPAARVPMDASVVRSLNVSTVVGMTLAEARRQRTSGG